MIPPKIVEKIRSLVGRECTLQRVGNDKSLFIGFGNIHNMNTTPHGTWEIGAYDCSWRVVRSGSVLCGRDDAIDKINDLQTAFRDIKLGDFVSLNHLTDLDIRITFLCGTAIDVLCTISEDDEVLHIFFPENQVIVFSVGEGWRMGRSDKPWE